MTDFRMRNHDLLYADAGRRRPTDWRQVAIFGAIGFTVAFGVVSYLTDSFNAASSGFNPTGPALAAQDQAAPAPLVRLARPAPTREGS